LKDQPIDRGLTRDKPPALEKYFSAAVKVSASDLHVKADKVPRMRVGGHLQQTTGEVISEKRVEEMVWEILSAQQKEFFLEHGAIDFAYDLDGRNRFRVNIFRQRSKISLAARHVSSEIPPFEKLYLPPSVEQFAEIHQGLVLVTGVTGSGKSTTIASILNFINHKRACHIITIEDPIEYVYEDVKSIINQREVGIDVPTFSDALRSMMREDPDVILIGEIRDYTTLAAGLQAAETGHLVFATLHSTDAYLTIQRIMDLTPQEERHSVRQAVAGNLKAILSQRLLPTVRDEPKRVPAVEILLVNSIVQKLISEEREIDVGTVIRTSYAEGMIDYTESLRQLVEKEFINLKTAYTYATNPDELKMAIKGIRTGVSGIIG
jgi:twitching motility protein PilT